MGNENSYTPEFFDELANKIDWEQSFTTRAKLEKYIILATQKYMSLNNDYHRKVPPHEATRELKKALNHIDKAAESLIKVYGTGHYTNSMIDNFHKVIKHFYPTLHGMLDKIRRTANVGGTIRSPMPTVDYLASLSDAIEATLKTVQDNKISPKSTALYQWLMIVAARLEPALGRKLEQSRYYKGEYISKRPISDSELLKFIITPLDPDVTTSQLETAIKDTRKERHEMPWTDYYPT